MRGEWQEIPAENAAEPPALPEHPSGGDWSSAAGRQWAAWWRDGASTTWTSADVVSLDIALLLADEVGRPGGARFAGELRLRLDGLGLTPKGKRDLRLVIEESDEEPEPVTATSIADYKSRADAHHNGARARRGPLTARERYGDLKVTNPPTRIEHQ